MVYLMKQQYTIVKSPLIFQTPKTVCEDWQIDYINKFKIKLITNGIYYFITKSSSIIPISTVIWTQYTRVWHQIDNVLYPLWYWLIWTLCTLNISFNNNNLRNVLNNKVSKATSMEGPIIRTTLIQFLLFQFLIFDKH